VWCLGFPAYPELGLVAGDVVCSRNDHRKDDADFGGLPWLTRLLPCCGYAHGQWGLVIASESVRDASPETENVQVLHSITMGLEQLR
jgi:hypothetical protein